MSVFYLLTHIARLFYLKTARRLWLLKSNLAQNKEFFHAFLAQSSFYIFLNKAFKQARAVNIA